MAKEKLILTEEEEYVINIRRKMKTKELILERIQFWENIRNSYAKIFQEAEEGKRKFTYEQLSDWQSTIWKYDTIINELKYIVGIYDYPQWGPSGEK